MSYALGVSTAGWRDAPARDAIREGALALGWTAVLASAALLASLVVQVGLALLAARRIRPPAAAWLLAPLGVWAIALVGGALAARQGLGALATAEPATFLAAATSAASDAALADGIGLLATSASLLLTAWLAALGAFLGAGPERRRSLAHAVLPLGIGGCGAIGALVAGVLGGAALVGGLVAAGALVATFPVAVASARRSAARADDARLVAARGLVGFAGAGAAPFLALGLGQLVRARALDAIVLGAPDDRVALASAAVEGWRVAGIAGGIAAAGIASAALVATALAPTAAGSWRTLLGALCTGVLALLAVIGGSVARDQQLGALEDQRRGGAVGELPDPIVAGLPRPRDLAGPSATAPDVVGTCLVLEGRAGWDAAPLYPALDAQAWILRHDRPDAPIPELERAPGCPDALGPLPGPLSTYEPPIVAVPADRLAVSLTMTRWFLREGTLAVLLAPEDADPADLPAAARAWRYRAAPFAWEMPPEGERVGDGDDVWDYEGAATLPVTLLEGRQPVLIAGGSREILPSGEAGAARLRDALLAAERRDLVLVPRKHWRVRELVELCLTVVGHVEGARCVLRPENPDRWSARTGLPLPWTTRPSDAP